MFAAETEVLKWETVSKIWAARLLGLPTDQDLVALVYDYVTPLPMQC